MNSNHEALATRLKLELQNIIDLEGRAASDRQIVFCFDDTPLKVNTTEGNEQALTKPVLIRTETTVRTPADLPTLRASREVAVECYNSILDLLVNSSEILKGAIINIGNTTIERRGTTITYFTEITWVKVYQH